MATPAYAVGKNVTCSFDGSTVKARGGSVNEVWGEDTVTNSEGVPYDEFVSTTGHLEISLELVFAAAPGIDAGTEYPFSVPVVAGHTYAGDCLVSAVNNQWTANGSYGLTISGKSSGPYTKTTT